MRSAAQLFALRWRKANGDIVTEQHGATQGFPIFIRFFPNCRSCEVLGTLGQAMWLGIKALAISSTNVLFAAGDQN